MLKLYNSLTRSVDDFYSIKEKNVSIYSCGPTVYKYAHIGNMRAYVFMDTLIGVLKNNGYTVKAVMNITDVGHLTDDSDSGEDKVEKAAKYEGQTVDHITKKYTDAFIEDAKKLNINLDNIMMPKATDHIKEMIEYIKEIIENGFAYVIDGSVYFDVEKYNKKYTYGELSRVNLEDQFAGARVEVDSKKKNPYDFALWIKAPSNHIMKWDSPWSVGYPGWHIECNAMGQKYLGEKFDIHTGGIDHIRFHHDNEICQSRARYGNNHSNFWLHCEFLNMGGNKLSKSSGELITISELEKKGYSALDFRYFLLNASFFKAQNFSYDALSAARTSMSRLNDLVLQNKDKTSDVDQTQIDKYKSEFYRSVNDNLNTSLGLAVVWEMLKNMPKSSYVYDCVMEFDKILGLSLGSRKEDISDIPEDVIHLAEKRKNARVDKNYELSDNLRKEIENKGYIVEDIASGYKLKRR